jgi:predicted RNase H-like HicB family nuclease
MEKLSCNVSIITEKMGKKMIYLARCEELGISDFGDNVQEALKNLKSGLNLLLKNDPERAKLLKKEEPLLTTRIFL